MTKQSPAAHVVNDPLRPLIERAVSEHIGRPWQVHDSRDMAEFASHPSAILSGGGLAVFAKFSAAEDALEQFTSEVSGLRLLSERAGILTPAPIGIVPAPGGCILILEAVLAVERGSRQWREIGQALARIHRVKGGHCGLDAHGFFGPLRQDNTPERDWPTFYAEHRLRPGLRLAVDSGHLPATAARLVEKLISRLPELCGPERTPSLLHGDAQQNNFISTEQGAAAIDPAVYYGNPELDLAMVDYFEPVPNDVLDGYRDELPVDPGFPERCDLWRVWGYLGCVAVEGGVYVDKLMEAVRKYV